MKVKVLGAPLNCDLQHSRCAKKTLCIFMEEIWPTVINDIRYLLRALSCAVKKIAVFRTQ